MRSDIFNANIHALRSVNPQLAGKLERISGNDVYGDIIYARSGRPVPCYSDGTPANSRYNPEVEGERTISGIGSDVFVCFAGITGAFHIRAFLHKHPGVPCAAAEISPAALVSLLSVLPMEDVLANRSVHILEDLSPGTICRELPNLYLPAIHGSFQSCSPRSWAERFSELLTDNPFTDALEHIARDYSVQAHFGKIWFSNFVKNMVRCDTGSTVQLPVSDCNKTALVAAAGPSLEDALPRIVSRRSEYVLFSTDTAYGTLRESGIIPDYYVTIDPQFYSTFHLYPAFSPETCVIADSCAHHRVVSAAVQSASPLILTAGGHPLARYAAARTPLPPLATASGTVTAAARDAAYALGFSSVSVIGADFSYPRGKPYARGTYLSKLFDSCSQRIAPSHSAYASLMFRTDVQREINRNGITYIPPTLAAYRRAFEALPVPPRWTPDYCVPHDGRAVLSALRHDLEQCIDSDSPGSFLFEPMMPFFAWYQKNQQPSAGHLWRKKAIELALDMIAGYTGVS